MKKRIRNELAEWTLWQMEEREGTRRGSAEPSSDGGAGTGGARRNDGGSEAHGAAGVWECGIGKGNDQRRVGRAAGGRVCGGCAIRPADAAQKAGVYGGDSSYAGTGD